MPCARLHDSLNIGQFNDEIEDEYSSGTYTSKFFASTAKSYGYELSYPDGSRKLISKIKGITQSVQCLQQFSLEGNIDCSSKGFVIEEP